VLLLWWFVGSPLVGWIGYQAITPSGWHNASVHGHVTSMHYAVSQDVPGLMLACGPRVEHVLRLQFVDLIQRCWRTRDGGGHWEEFIVPVEQRSIVLIAPRQDQGHFFAIARDLDYAGPEQPAQATVWVTRDAGADWRQVASIPGTRAVRSLPQHRLPGAY